MPASSATVFWSFSRHRTWLECARRFYWRYLVQGGWRSDAPEDARQAYLLKHLTTLYGALGITLHNLARECAQRCRGGQEILPHEVLLRRVRAELNRVCLSSEDRGAFLRFPTRNPMLQDVWLHGERSPETDERVRDRMHACVRTLAEHPIWEELAALSPDDIVVVDSLSTFELDQVLVYAAPDLVYLPAPGRVVIGDWKSGGGEDDDHMLQLAVYALWARDGLGLPWTSGWQGRVMDLLRGEDLWYDLTEADLEAARVRIRTSVAAIADAEGLAEEPSRDLFPVLPPDRRSICPGCVFYSLCAPELSLSPRLRFAPPAPEPPASA